MDDGGAEPDVGQRAHEANEHHAQGGQPEVRDLEKAREDGRKADLQQNLARLDAGAPTQAAYHLFSERTHVTIQAGYGQRTGQARPWTTGRRKGPVLNQIVAAIGGRPDAHGSFRCRT